ncbi:MAG: hypothetical protein IJU45_05000 [Clostridia bacterium]|nr:hypothetical protein [Clostridia bacterium]
MALKKIICPLLALTVLICSLPLFSASADYYDDAAKRIVGVVYEDSLDMQEDNKYLYTGHALQTLLGVFDRQDELVLVRTSNPGRVMESDFSDDDYRQIMLDTVDRFGVAGTVSFAPVDTAVEWMKSRVNELAASQHLELWFIVIANGKLGDMSDFEPYLNELKRTAGNSRLEAVYISTGNNSDNDFTKKWTTDAGNHFYKAESVEEIVSAAEKTAGLILRCGADGAISPLPADGDGKSVKFSTSVPLKSFIVYERGLNAGISEIKVDGSDAKAAAGFYVKQPDDPQAPDSFIHCSGSGIIPPGDVTLSFDKSVDVSDGNLKVLPVPAVSIDLLPHDKSGNIAEPKALTLSDGERVSFSAELSSAADGDLTDNAGLAGKLSAQLVINGKAFDMKYDKESRVFRGDGAMRYGDNIAYSVVTLPGVFRVRSEAVNLFIPETLGVSAKTSAPSLKIPYKHCTEYEEVGKIEYTVSGKKLNGVFELEFQGVPKGIKVSVNGAYADKKGKVYADIRDGVPATVAFYRNKSFSESEEKTVVIRLSSERYLFDWAPGSNSSVVIQPVRRDLVSVSENAEGPVKFDALSKSCVGTVFVKDEERYLSKEELESLVPSFSKVPGLSFRTQTEEIGGKYAIRIYPVKGLAAQFAKTGKTEGRIKLVSPYSELTESAFEFTLLDSFSKHIFTIILFAAAIIAAGHLPGVKKRIPDGKLFFVENGVVEPIMVDPLSRIFPYVRERGSASILGIKAASLKDSIIVEVFDPHEKVLKNGASVRDPSYIVMSENDVLEIKQDTGVYTYLLAEVHNEEFEYETYGDTDDDNYDKPTDDDSDL